MVATADLSEGKIVEGETRLQAEVEEVGGENAWWWGQSCDRRRLYKGKILEGKTRLQAGRGWRHKRFYPRCMGSTVGVNCLHDR